MSLNIAQVPTTNKHVGRLRPIRVIVIHTGETSEGPTAAEGMCSWAANPAAGGSFHIAVDTDSACRSVDDADTAWGAPGVNADGLHLELAGRAGQTTSEWADASSEEIMRRGAAVVADWETTYDIPIRWLTDAELADGETRGFCTHAQASRVFGGDHWDPGPNFPADYFLTLCLAAAGLEGDDMAIDYNALAAALWGHRPTLSDGSTSEYTMAQIVRGTNIAEYATRNATRSLLRGLLDPAQAHDALAQLDADEAKERAAAAGQKQAQP